MVIIVVKQVLSCLNALASMGVKTEHTVAIQNQEFFRMRVSWSCLLKRWPQLGSELQEFMLLSIVT